MLVIVFRRKRFFLPFICLVFIISIISYSILAGSGNTADTVGIQTKYLIYIQLDERTLYLYKDGNCIKHYPIATGRPDLPSPIGDWEIVEKGDWGEHFGGRWLGLNVKWGNYGIHGTMKESSIGSAASHGCIRMFNSDVKELYDMVSVGTPVIIRSGIFGPFGTGFRNLRPGDRGADVVAVQERLKDLGYFDGEVTGIYEDDLKLAIYKFQREHSLRVKYTLTMPDYNAMGFREFE